MYDFAERLEGRVGLMNTVENVQITSKGIQNSLKRYKPLQALSEYVWNGFDAGATTVEISILENNMQGIAQISVQDNGTGIDYSMLSQKFKPFFQSEKVYDPTEKHSVAHGKNGVGRLTFFAFANIAKWATVYRKDNQNYTYEIDINAATLESFFSSSENQTEKVTGTLVVFDDLVSQEITEDTAKIYLAQEFCWFLELHKDKGFSIYINGEPLDYSNLILKIEEQTYLHEETNARFSVKYVCWEEKLSEYSKYYYIRSDGTEVFKENTTLNNKGDRFYHSVYIQSTIFDTFDFGDQELQQITLETFFHKKSPEYLFIIQCVNRHLYDMRRPFIKQTVSKIVNDLEIESAFPGYNPRNPMDQYKKSQLTEMVSSIYIAQPKIFTGAMNREQRKTFIRLLDLIMESGEVDSLFKIFDEILDMTELERQDLADILKYTQMSNVTKTIRLIQDRYRAVDDLKQLVFNPDLHANEVNHLQKMIEKHYWLFGEQYSLVTAAEPNFEEALRRHLRYLHKEYEEAGVDHSDKLKQMDIFAVRQDVSHEKFHNIVVELKHPNIHLGETQLSQVKRYMNVIMSIPEFNADNMSWEFYLLGNKFSTDGYIEGELMTNKPHGEPFLVFQAPRYKVYVLRWSEVFANFEMRHSYLNEKLQLERAKLQKQYATADEVITGQAANTAGMPAEMAPTR